MSQAGAQYLSGGVTRTFTALTPTDISTATPKANGTAAAGTSTSASAADHVHPTDTTRAASGANTDLTSVALTTMTCSGSARFGASATTAGAVIYSPNGNSSYFGIYDANNAAYYGISVALPSPAGTAVLGGYYSGLGVGGRTSNKGNPIFGVLNSSQSGNGKGSTALTVYDNNNFYSYRNTLDDGTGAMSVASTLAVAGVTTLSAPLKPASYTVSTLPAGTNGYLAFASNGLNAGEASGSGTGVLVVYSNSAWRRLSDGSAVAS